MQKGCQTRRQTILRHCTGHQPDDVSSQDKSCSPGDLSLTLVLVFKTPCSQAFLRPANWRSRENAEVLLALAGSVGSLAADAGYCTAVGSEGVPHCRGLNPVQESIGNSKLFETLEGPQAWQLGTSRVLQSRFKI